MAVRRRPAYTRIPLAPTTHPDLVRFVRERVEPYLWDVRFNLNFPVVSGQPGFNLTAAVTLCTVVAGLARVFYNKQGGDKVTFTLAAVRYAQIEQPGATAADHDSFALALYKVYRNSLVHSLGLAVVERPGKKYEIQPRGTQTKVTRWGRPPFNPAKLRRLDQLGAWAETLPPTLATRGDVERLNVDALYCGVRRLTKALAEDIALAPDAVAFLDPWAHPPQSLTLTPSASPATMSSTPIFYSRTGLDVTLGAMTAVRSGTWDPK